MHVAQGLTVLAGGYAPIGRALHGVYATGLRAAIARLARHDAVHSIYGCGSFFEGSCLYGHSDVDLVLVLKPSTTRAEGRHGEIARTYERVRRCFPFLGRWDEKAASLIFLDEVATGFPVLESFRVRMKQGRLVRLYGDAFPVDLGTAPLTLAEIAAECSALLRTGMLAGGSLAWSALFWKRLLGKLRTLAESAARPAVAAAIDAESRRRFGTLSDRQLFFRRAHPRALCTELVRATAALSAALREGAPTVALRFTTPTPPADVAPSPRLAQDVRDLLRAAGCTEEPLRFLAPIPIGLTPQLFYFPPDAPIPFVDLVREPYDGLRRLLAAMRKTGAPGHALLVRGHGTLFIATKHETYTDLVALDPNVHANLYAWVAGDSTCTIPHALVEELRAEARQRGAALAALYRRHEDWVPKAGGPGVYREDDLDTINNALAMLRSMAAAADPPTLFTTAEDLLADLACRHPEARAFLSVLRDDLRFHRGEVAERPAAPNLYRCLHQFMAQVLTGAPRLELDDHERGLQITVGIITRNRAEDLREALASLEGLRRRPDEVVVVDNGSTDHTRAVIESFADRLPVRYVLEPEPSIPRARNAVIAHARHEVIAFTDDDCAVGRDWLTAVERGFMRARNVGIVGGWVLHWSAPEPSTVDTYFGFFHHNKP